MIHCFEEFQSDRVSLKSERDFKACIANHDLEQDFKAHFVNHLIYNGIYGNGIIYIYILAPSFTMFSSTRRSTAGA